MELLERGWPEERTALDLAPVREALRLLALALAVALVLWLPLSGLVRSGALPDGHDVRPHLINTAAYARAFAEGSSWPRWLPDLSAGHGGANPLLYSPLPFHLTGRLVLSGLSTPQALAAGAVFAMFAAFAGVWFWMRRAGADWAGALAAAALYSLGPYHLFDLYGRFAYPELLGMGLAPWIFGVMEAPADRRCARIAVGAGLALLWLTHNLSVVLFGGLLAARALALAVRERSRAPLMTFVYGGLIAAGLAAFAWVPLVEDMPQTRIALDGSMKDGWRLHLLAPARLLDAHWPGTREHLPVYPGRLQLALAALGVIALVARARARPAQGELVFAGAVAGLLFLMLTPSAALWEHTPLPMVQFPWRFLAPVSLGLAALGAQALPAHRHRGGVALCVAAAAAIAAAPLSTSEPFRGHVIAPEALRNHVETGDFENKYLPLGAHLPLRTAEPVCAIVQGRGRVVASSAGPHRHELALDLATPCVLEVRQYDFAGWRATVDGKPAALAHEFGYGLLRLPVPEGAHHVVVERGLTPLHAWATALSASVAALALALLLPYRGLGRAIPVALVSLALAGTLVNAVPRGDAKHARQARLALVAGDVAGARAALARIDPAGPYGPWAARHERVQREHGAVLTQSDGVARRVPRLDIDRRLELPVPGFRPRDARLTATVEVDLPGTYELSVESDAPALLRIDGAAVISHPGAPPADLAAARERPSEVPPPRPVRVAVERALASGPHAIELAYRDETGRGACRVWWRPPGRAWSPIPQEALAPRAPR